MPLAKKCSAKRQQDKAGGPQIGPQIAEFQTVRFDRAEPFLVDSIVNAVVADGDEVGIQLIEQLVASFEDGQMILKRKIAHDERRRPNVEELLFLYNVIGKNAAAEHGIGLSGVQLLQGLNQAVNNNELTNPASLDRGFVGISGCASRDALIAQIVGLVNRLIVFTYIDRSGQNQVSDGKIRIGGAFRRENQVGQHIDLAGLEITQKLAPRTALQDRLQIAVFRDRLHQIDQEP